MFSIRSITMRLYIYILILVLISPFQELISQSKFPDKYTPDRTFQNQSIFDLVNIPEDNMDIGLWALIVAEEFDPRIDVNYYLSQLDEFAEEIKQMLASRTKDMDKFLATRMFLYDSDSWNNFNPFSYDLSDPFGEDLSHHLLSNYIDTRKGNCVSMPTLFLALMERVDPNLKIFGVAAPLHLFCRLRDRQTRDVWNVETTNGGNPARNQWYIDKMNISQKALDNNLYLNDLTKKEFIAHLIGALISKERRKGNFEEAMKYVDLVLEIDPKTTVGIVNKGALSAEIAYEKTEKGTLTEEEDNFYKSETEKYIAKAKELGWKPESREESKKYIESVKTELEKNNLEEK